MVGTTRQWVIRFEQGQGGTTMRKTWDALAELGLTLVVQVALSPRAETGDDPGLASDNNMTSPNDHEQARAA